MMHTLYAAVLETRNYVVGAAHGASGLYRRDDDGWTHLGWRNARCFGVAVHPETPETIVLACGNGVLRSTDGGTSWCVTTDWRVTEVLDVALAPNRPETIYAATAYGVWRSPDGGDTWTPASDGIPAPTATFTQTLVADASHPGRLLAGTEGGLFVSTDRASTWHPVGPHLPIRTLRQHPMHPERWWAGTEDHGLLRSTDGGATWQRVDGDISETTIYAVALDLADPQHVAAAGFRTGLLVSRDGGASWTQQPLDLPAHSVHALAFDPDVPGRLWLGTVDAGVFVTDDGGVTCTDAGLPETTLYGFHFVASVSAAEGAHA